MNGESNTRIEHKKENNTPVLASPLYPSGNKKYPSGEEDLDTILGVIPLQNLLSSAEPVVPENTENKHSMPKTPVLASRLDPSGEKDLDTILGVIPLQNLLSSADSVVPENKHSMPKKATQIYVLALEHGMRYVGKTDLSPELRFQQHLEENSKNAAAWCKLHKPLSVVSCYPQTSLSSEDECVLQLMANPMFGIDRVRGGSFSSIDIEPHRKTIVAMLATRANVCYLCHLPNHVASACPKSESTETVSVGTTTRTPTTTNRMTITKNNREDEITERSRSWKPYDRTIPTPRKHVPDTRKHVPDTCYRCGRNSHYRADCFAVTHLQGHYLPS